MNRHIIAERTGSGVSITMDGYAVAHVPKHSPTGMEYGYGGSGPADTARSILLKIVGEKLADRWYQSFKWDFVAKWQGNRVETDVDIEKWIEEKERDW